MEMIQRQTRKQEKFKKMQKSMKMKGQNLTKKMSDIFNLPNIFEDYLHYILDPNDIISLIYILKT